MREIKFRAWDEEFEEMFYSDKRDDVHFFEFNSKGKLRGYAIRGPKSGDDPLEPPEPYCDDYPVQQFTGLLDKQGKEIYEGDKLFNPADSYPYYIIKWNEKECWFELDENGEKLSKYQLSNYWTIIGNIYENPELLESDEKC